MRAHDSRWRCCDGLPPAAQARRGPRDASDRPRHRPGRIAMPSQPPSASEAFDRRPTSGPRRRRRRRDRRRHHLLQRADVPGRDHREGDQRRDRAGRHLLLEGVQQQHRQRRRTTSAPTRRRPTARSTACPERTARRRDQCMDFNPAARRGLRPTGSASRTARRSSSSSSGQSRIERRDDRPRHLPGSTRGLATAPKSENTNLTTQRPFEFRRYQNTTGAARPRPGDQSITGDEGGNGALRG